MALIGTRVKKLRLERHLTQAEVGDVLKVSQQQVARWEVGNIDVSSESVIRLARLLECTSDYLLGLSDMPRANFQPPPASSEEQRILTLYRHGKFAELITLFAQTWSKRDVEINPAVKNGDESILSDRQE